MVLKAQPGPIHQNVTDISDPSQLLRYALAGQLERLKQYRKDEVSQADVAWAARLRVNNKRDASSALSHALRDGPSAKQLLALDEILGALVPDLDGPGGLSSLNLRLAAEGQGDQTLMATVPPSWTSRLLREPHPSSELEVLAQASALLSAFTAAAKVDQRSVEAVRNRYSAQMENLVRRLILISVSPPTSRNYDAQIMLGSLASYAFEQMKGWLDAEVLFSPLAFRVWRAVTKLVKLRGDGEHEDELREWIEELVGASQELRTKSLYPGRSLDLELALVVPAKWSPPDNDWVGDALLTRAQDQYATIRERGTAAMGLWQRALKHDRKLTETKDALGKLIAEFRDPNSRPDAAAGLEWVATTLECAIDGHVPVVCDQWPQVDQAWFRNVQKAADQLGRWVAADHLRTGTKNLFLNMILQNAGVYRRQAIETVVTAGMTNPIAKALGYLLENEREEPWLRIRAEFALGFLQRVNSHVEMDLTRACRDAFANLRLGDLKDGEELPRSQVTEVHASLFAVGDCFGVAGAEDWAKTARETLRPVLTVLADPEYEHAWKLRRAARAAAYLLTVTAQPREGGEMDMSEVLLRQLSDHPDMVTRRLSSWALFRFASDGTVKPLIDGPKGAVGPY